MTVAEIPCSILRGGTSKGVFFDADALPDDPGARDRVLMRVMGSPDPRQIDGLGGADPLTSKIVIMDRNAPDGCDATYTFGQVGIEEEYVRYSANCGNLSAAAAVYAIERGMVQPESRRSTTVRLFNSNTSSVLVVHVPTDGHGFVADGDFAIAGVPGTGSEIRLDFSATLGANVGKLLPYDAPTVAIHVPELGRDVDVSVVDVGKTAMFFRAVELGLTGTEGPNDLSDEQLASFWWIRNVAARDLGFGPGSGHMPTPIAVAPPQEYPAYGSATVVRPDQIDFCARRVIGPPPRLHKAFAGTGAVCAAVAAITPGTVVHALMPAGRTDGLVRLGHPSGVLPLRARFAADGTLAEASFSRTARWILDGVVYAQI